MARHAPPVRLRCASPTITAVETSAPLPTPTGFPLNGWASQSYYAISNVARFADPNADETVWAAQRDVIIPQMFGPYDSNMSLTVTYWKNLRGQNPNLKIVPYTSPSEPRKVDDGSIGGENWVRELLDSSSRGNPDWYLRNVSGDKVESLFSNRNYRSSWTSQFQPNNSFGRSFPEQYYNDWSEKAFELYTNGVWGAWVDGLYTDVVPPAFQRVYVDGQTGTADTQDFDQNGVAESAGDESNINRGELAYRAGVATWPPAFRAYFPSDWAIYRNGTRDGIDYTSGILQNSTIPMSQSALYQAWDGTIYEGATDSIGFRKGTSPNYSIPWGGGMNWFFHWVERQRTTIVPPATHPWADGVNDKYLHTSCLTVECKFFDLDTPANWNAVRFFGGLCALTGASLGHCVNKAVGLPPLDEYVIDWGDTITPYNGSNGDRHAMGILDPTTAVNGTDADWSGNRPPDFENGVADFHWCQFQNVIWVVRTDQNGLVGGSHGDGSAISCTLPSAGSGFHWERFDVTSTQTNPNTGLQTRGQDTTLNSGGTVTSISLLPWHAQMLLRVAD